MVLAAVAILSVPETSSRTGKLGLQRLSVPPEVRSVFITAALAAFAGFAVTGLFTSVAPSLLTNVIGIGNHALAGLMAGSIFGASAIAQIAGTRIEPQRAVAWAAAYSRRHGHSGCRPALFVTGRPDRRGVVAGAGQGISFSRGLGGGRRTHSGGT